jgi:hypothetical protein
MILNELIKINVINMGRTGRVGEASLSKLNP